MPFIGDGDIAVELYTDRVIYGADLDPARIATCTRRLRDLNCSGFLATADCDSWPFSRPETLEPIQPQPEASKRPYGPKKGLPDGLSTPLPSPKSGSQTAPHVPTIQPFAVADFDAYSNPYRSLAAFWTHAPKARRVVLFGTDGLRQAIVRKKQVKELPSGQGKDDPGWRKQYNSWWIGHVLPYLTGLLRPYKIVKKLAYLRGGGMLYWGLVVEK